MDALNSDQKTLNGGTLTYYRKFRKNWLDYAIIGLKSEGPWNEAPSGPNCTLFSGDGRLLEVSRGRSGGG